MELGVALVEQGHAKKPKSHILKSYVERETYASQPNIVDKAHDVVRVSIDDRGAINIADLEALVAHDKSGAHKHEGRINLLTRRTFGHNGLAASLQHHLDSHALRRLIYFTVIIIVGALGFRMGYLINYVTFLWSLDILRRIRRTHANTFRDLPEERDISDAGDSKRKPESVTQHVATTPSSNHTLTRHGSVSSEKGKFVVSLASQNSSVPDIQASSHWGSVGSITEEDGTLSVPTVFVRPTTSIRHQETGDSEYVANTEQSGDISFTDSSDSGGVSEVWQAGSSDGSEVAF